MLDPFLVDLIGTLAGALTTFSFLPQVIKTWRSRSTRDISLTMFTVFFTGALLWLVYGMLLESFPIILANAVTMVLVTTVIGLKLRYRHLEALAS
ncbi:MAG: SemiSWEET transporter [Alphaproteobacteria bacterium]|nr:SemiSWEET transporter [Alphaproteobacteria bacterium]MBU0795732.1 SemiSWEET transporter [Alphaproteobacteria bacterium]MBU0887355.1 SemiSWEET transporter [Alphaproteobacteria bacterium]MBU1811764.1 SemiSWEET transporter [Alphaproteobacteria bacterium]MBU2089339.1 SemiSWEET transporter [Alphaproteobacteria bacterium]